MTRPTSPSMGGGHGHAHQPVGDPRALQELKVAVDVLVEDPEADDGRRRAHNVLDRYSADENPRTRAQVRALRVVLRLLDEGDTEGARDLLENELQRSFPGRGDVAPGWEAADRALPNKGR